MHETPSKPKVGFIGFGIMGRPMALNLLHADYPLWGWARREGVMDAHLSEGATACASPQEVAAHADIIFTIVSDTPDVEQVVLGEHGIVHGARPGSVVVDMSTISPVATRRIAEELAARGVEMLDAPVSGGEQGAIQGSLSIMAGGKAEVFQHVLPLFEVLGKNVLLVGSHGAGQIAKTCNQILAAQTIAAVGEALLLAKAAGVDPAKVRQALLGGFAGSKILEIHGQRMLTRSFDPGFKANLHHKDLRIALETAAETGISLPGAEQAAHHLRAVLEAGLGELDSSALVQVLEREAGVNLA